MRSLVGGAVNTSNGRKLAEKVLQAETLSERMRGLLGRSTLPVGEALLLDPCRAIHTAGMRFPIDVLFLDLNMPKVDGPGVLQRLREGNHLRPHFIAILSASSEESSSLKVLKGLGADALIPKPWEDWQINHALDAAEAGRE